MAPDLIKEVWATARQGPLLLLRRTSSHLHRYQQIRKPRWSC